MKAGPGLVGVPCTASMPTRVSEALTRLALELPEGSEIRFERGGDRTQIPHKRQKMAERVVASDHLRWLFFIDTDTVFRLRDAKLVLGGLDKWDICCGLVPSRYEGFVPNVGRYPDTAPRSVDPMRPTDFPGFTRVRKEKPNPLHLERWRGYYECNTAGTAFMAIGRHVFEGLESPWFVGNLHRKPSICEDQNFTLRATDAGFTMAADMRVRCEHLAEDWGVTFEYAKAWMENRWGLGWGVEVGPSFTR